ncbi:dihydropteroate synthase [Neisseriaceae bacterium PsAf]|nr:dihydropteroate synthase [Neisseriaceae bacterium PsAf]MCV2502598.1 dihydropteroate synthase [Neisseriaceae bacterium]
MGIVNITPDSFSDGAMYSKNINTALKHAEQLLNDGADILDIGGESSRPNADFVSPEEEWSRVKDILQEIKHWQVPISLDTRRSKVMQKALELDAVDMINDIEALSDYGAMQLMSQHQSIAVVLMHMQGQPHSMQINPSYDNVTQEVSAFLKQRISSCVDIGIDVNRLIVDPGIGFGKTLEHNLALIRNTNTLIDDLQRPLLIGVSRKSMFEKITGEKDPQQRIGSGITAEIEAVRRGASFIRVHNVKQTRQALLTYLAINSNE